MGVAGAWEVVEVVDSVGTEADDAGEPVETVSADEEDEEGAGADGAEVELGAGAGPTPLPLANLAAKHCFISCWSVYPWSPMIGVRARP